MDASRERIAGAVPAWVTQLPAAFQQDFASGSCHRDLLNAVGSLHQHLGILHQHQQDLLNGQQDVINEVNILKRFVSEIKTQLDGHEVTYPIPIVTCTRLEMLTYASVTEGNACNCVVGNSSYVHTSSNFFTCCFYSGKCFAIELSATSACG